MHKPRHCGYMCFGQTSKVSEYGRNNSNSPLSGNKIYFILLVIVFYFNISGQHLHLLIVAGITLIMVYPLYGHMYQLWNKLNELGIIN